MLRAIGSAGEAPWLEHGCLIHAGTAIWILPVPLGIQPDTFGGACSALLSTVRATPAECKHRLIVSRLPVVSVEDRESPTTGTSRQGANADCHTLAA
jgi:hypothetical protein